MKSNKNVSMIFLALFFVFYSSVGCSQNEDFPQKNAQVAESEAEGLILMREEEKLARDVYLTLYDIHKIAIFNNIANSEQKHMDAIKTLLNQYEIEDPIKSDKVGVFTSPKLKKLYDDLTQQGSKSLTDGLIVGATIEDLDIYDLNNLSTGTTNEDILFVYYNLNRGSRNHMRSFITQLDNIGGKYTPQYISADEFKQIITSEKERGGNKNGKFMNQRGKKRKGMGNRMSGKRKFMN